MTAATDPGATGALDRSLAHLLGRVALVELRVRDAVARRQAGGDPDPGDPVRGAYLSDAYVSWLLDRQSTGPDPQADARARLERDADSAEADGADLRLRRLSRNFGLDPVEEELLIVAAAPMLDRRFGQLYGYLNDDVTRRYATVALAVELATGSAPGDPRDWLRAAPGSRLRGHGLVEARDSEEPLPAQTLSVPARVVAHLLGDDTTAPGLTVPVLEVEPLPATDPALTGSPRTTLLREHPGATASVEAAAWLSEHGPPPLVVDLGPAPGPDSTVVDHLVRESLLTRRPVVAGPVDAWAEDVRGRADLRRLVASCPLVVLWTAATTETGRVALPVPSLELPIPPSGHRLRLWRLLCGDTVPDEDLRLLAARHRVGGARIHRAVLAARAAATGAPGLVALETALREQDGAPLQGLARRVRPVRSWTDLVLPASTVRDLRDLISMVRHRDQLAESWGLARGGTGRGVAGLFVGPSGTGKTLAAEVVARELGGDLYVVDPARVVDKYVGETEKNLDRVLSAAEGSTGVLFFDEAESLFGRRAEVRQGHDRYANLEVSYLLQRVETVGAVVLLATNYRSQLDEAFTRRVDAVVDFPAPDVAAREALWRRHLARLQLAEDVDLGLCAATFELTGGGIRNAAAAAACLAVDEARPVSRADLLRGVDREYAKLGRLRVAADRAAAEGGRR